MAKLKDVKCKDKECFRGCPIVDHFKVCMSLKTDETFGEVVNKDEFKALNEKSRKLVLSKLEGEEKVIVYGKEKK